MSVLAWVLFTYKRHIQLSSHYRTGMHPSLQAGLKLHNTAALAAS